MLVSMSGCLFSTAGSVVDVVDIGVSPCHSLGVSMPIPWSPLMGVMLVPLLPRSLRPSGPGVMTSVNLLPAAAIHSLS